MCKVKARLKGRRVVLQTLGYRGKREARTTVGDLRQARSFIVYKKDAKNLKVGSTVTVQIGRKRIHCKVRKWARGSRLLLPTEPEPFKRFSTRGLRRLIVK